MTMILYNMHKCIETLKDIIYIETLEENNFITLENSSLLSTPSSHMLAMGMDIPRVLGLNLLTKLIYY